MAPVIDSKEEAASAMAAVFIAAIDGFVARLPVADPVWLFQSAVGIVLANGRVAFDPCKAPVQSPSATPQSARSSTG